MQTHHAAASYATPLFMFFMQILIAADVLEIPGILDQTDMIALLIILIETLEAGAGKGGAFVA